GVVQEHGDHRQVELARVDRRDGSGAVTPREDLRHAAGGLQRVLEIVIREVDGLKVTKLPAKHRDDILEQPSQKPPIMMRKELVLDRTQVERNRRGVAGVDSWEHGGGRSGGGASAERGLV